MVKVTLKMMLTAIQNKQPGPTRRNGNRLPSDYARYIPRQRGRHTNTFGARPACTGTAAKTGLYVQISPHPNCASRNENIKRRPESEGFV